MDFQFLFTPVEQLDSSLEGLFAGSSFLVAMLVALALGLRHASDPDHLVAVTSLVAGDRGDVRGAARLGAWWGAGHATALLALGIPLILLKSSLPAWLERGAETAVGAVILMLALRIVVKWVRGDYRSGLHGHIPEAEEADHRHLYRDRDPGHRHQRVRTPQQALGIGLLHGLAGTGAVVVLLIAALPSKLEAAAALAIFAPMSVLSMTICTTGFAWLLTRRLVDPLFRTVLIPAFGLFGLLFGAWYIGIG
jgi:high-affinity nickel permease